MEILENNTDSKLDYVAPVATVTDIEVEQAFLQTSGSGTLPGGGEPGGDV